MTTDLDLGLRHEDEVPGRESRRSVGTQVGRGLILALIVLALLAVAGVVILGIRTVSRMLTPGDYTGQGTGAVTIRVRTGDAATDMAATLADQHVVKSAEAFRRAASKDERSAKIQPGFYRLRSEMSASAALALLLTPSSRVSTRVVIPEGMTLDSALLTMARNAHLRLADLKAAVRKPTSIGLPAVCRGRVEGCLFPATYDFSPGTSAVDALRQMTGRFSEAAGEVGLVPGARSLRMSPYQVVTVASLLEKEVKLPADYPRVARVVYNRLAQGKPLEFDSTIVYVTHNRTGRVSRVDTRTPSPYNTYLHKGLPPTPINSPGELALRAALHPAAGKWIYFLTVDKTGRSAFVATYPEFLKLKATARRSGVL
ncbi:MAG: endolytic transglycosylase MltG [Frankiaceae bacterium]